MGFRVGIRDVGGLVVIFSSTGTLVGCCAVRKFGVGKRAMVGAMVGVTFMVGDGVGAVVNGATLGVAGASTAPLAVEEELSR